MTPETVRFLAQSEGLRLLAEAGTLPPDRLTRLTRLRRMVSAPIASAAVELLELRYRARRKFKQADRMFFTREGLEQSTGERIASYRASRFGHGELVLDACCGIGGDTLALVHRGATVGVERDPATAACARANLLEMAASERAAVLCADVTTLDLGRLRQCGIRAGFIDPSRRTDDERGGRRRVRTGEDYAPPLAWIETLRKFVPALAVKVSPVLQDEVLARLGGRVEFLSDQGECKEAVVWYGALAESPADGPTVGYTATVLDYDGKPHTLHPEPADLPGQSSPQAWIYEPDAAVIRAGRIAQVAAQIRGSHLDPHIAYLTSESSVVTPYATAYRVLDSMPFHLKNLQAWLRQHRRRVEVVKRRGVPLEPEEMRRRLAHTDLEGCSPLVLILTRIQDRPFAILCDPPL